MPYSTKRKNFDRRKFLTTFGSVFLLSHFGLTAGLQATSMRGSQMPSYDRDPDILRLYKAYEKYFDVSRFNPSEEWQKVYEYNVHIDRWSVPHPKARLLLLHGGGGHGRLLAPIAFAAQQNGIEAICPDLPGFGLTMVPDKSALTYDSWRKVALSIFEQETDNTVPTFVFGLSMGGMLAYDVCTLASNPRGLIATNLLDPTRQDVRTSMARWSAIEAVASAIINHAHGPSKSIMIPMKLAGDMRAISNDPILSSAIENDRRAGGNSMPVGFFQSFLKSKPLIKPESFTSCPVLLAHPGEDRWTDISVSLPFFEALSVDKKLVVLENAGHAPVESPGAQQLEYALVDFINQLSG